MSGTQWYYRREGAIQDETIGPITEDDIAVLIRGKKIKPSTFVFGQQATNGQWVHLSAIDFSGPLAKYDARQEQERLRTVEVREKADAARREAAARADHQKEMQNAAAQRAAEQHEAAKRMERERYLQAVSAHRRRYKVVVTDPHDSERVCNQLGFEGWDLEQAFAETFSHQPCCSQPGMSENSCWCSHNLLMCLLRDVFHFQECSPSCAGHDACA